MKKFPLADPQVHHLLVLLVLPLLLHRVQQIQLWMFLKFLHLKKALLTR